MLLSVQYCEIKVEFKSGPYHKRIKVYDLKKIYFYIAFMDHCLVDNLIK